MPKRTIKPFRPIYPSPAALITSIDAQGRGNIITLGECFNISIGIGEAPVIVGIAIAKPRYSHELISQQGEFVVNLPTAGLLEKVDRCGSVSGRNVDKFAEIGLTPLPAEQVAPPLIAECPMNLECRLRDVTEIGDHDLFTGEVLVEHVDEDCLTDAGTPDPERLDPLCYLAGQYWSAGRFLGTHGFTRKG